jgi:hypothetical protein
MALPRGGRELIDNKVLAGILGKSSCVEYQSISAPLPKPKFEPLFHSVYIGRERLGRYVQTGRNKYKAFDADDDPLGTFRVRAKMLAAIDKAWRARQ